MTTIEGDNSEETNYETIEEKKSSINRGSNKSWIQMLDSSEDSSMDSSKEYKESQDISLSEIINQHENSFESDEFKKNREIKIDFLDEENGKKFDRLVKEEKIKSPFKRRFSTEKDDKNNPCSRDEMEYKKTKFDDDCERFRTTSSSSGGSSNNSSKPPTEYETDQSILDRRQKQIEYGKNTIGYENYIAEVPIANRTKEHPKTPPKFIKFSRRGWDGLVKSWRKKLHCWDPENLHSSGQSKAKLEGSSENVSLKN